MRDRRRGWQKAGSSREPPTHKTGKRVAVVGSGPAGLACAQQLARAGHDVHVFEKNAKAGGLLRYGIPDFKMEKHLIDRRVAQMEAEGVTFHSGVEVGVDLAVRRSLVDGIDAVVLAGGAEKPRDLRSRAASSTASTSPWISCPSRTGASRGEPLGDSQADPRRRQACRGDRRRRHRLGLHRHLEPPGRASVTQLEIMPQPPEQREQGADLAGLAD